MPEPALPGADAALAEALARLACPACHGGLALEAGVVRCVRCGRGYPVQDGIPVLIAGRALGSGPENR